MEFLRNQWYTAAISAELGDKPLARTICNEPLVIFRSGNGNVAVLTDRCPHRKAPLSSGEVVGNDIQCGYHGIRIAPDGACTRVPGNAQTAAISGQEVSLHTKSMGSSSSGSVRLRWPIPRTSPTSART